MVARIRRGLTFANVCSFLALTIALGTGGAYAANTVFSTDIVDGEVKSADIGANQVGTGKIKSGNVTITDIGADAVDGSKVLDGAIATADLADGARRRLEGPRRSDRHRRPRRRRRRRLEGPRRSDRHRRPRRRRRRTAAKRLQRFAGHVRSRDGFGRCHRDRQLHSSTRARSSITHCSTTTSPPVRSRRPNSRTAGWATPTSRTTPSTAPRWPTTPSRPRTSPAPPSTARSR